MKMDGYDIVSGDNVYDVAFGGGVIDRIDKSGDRFWVLFGRASRCYLPTGVGNFSNRTLYWKNPVTVIPHKDDAAWDTTMKLSKVIGDTLGRKQ